MDIPPRARHWVGAIGLGVVCSVAWGVRSLSAADDGPPAVEPPLDALPTASTVALDDDPPAAADPPTTPPTAPPTSPPTSQPATDATPRVGGAHPRGGGRRRGGGGSGAMLGRAGGPFTPATPEQRHASMTFLAAHAPAWAAAILAKSPDDRMATEQAVAQEYAGFQRVRATDPELYGVILRRVEAVDRVYDLAGQYRRATPADRPGRREALRAALTAWSTINLDERRLRLRRLEDTVRAARDRLAADTAHPDRMVDERLDRITRSNADEGWPGPPTDPDGGR